MWLTASDATAIGHLNDADSSTRIVEGVEVAGCGFPTVVYTGGCTAALVHPRAVTSAQHCGSPSSATFGPTGSEHRVSIERCIGTGSADAQICLLAEAITELPVTPILYGCELDNYRTSGQDVVICGYGETAYGKGDGGTKRWGSQTIASVSNDSTVVGQAGVMPSPCPGDSGGPLLLQVDDGSWRVTGTVEGGTTGTPCNSACRYRQPDLVVPAFEEQTGVDITPCFDGASGEWEPTAECGGFWAGSEQNEGDGWGNWCAGTPVTGYSTQCGPAFGDDDDDDAGDDDDAAGDDDDDGDGEGDDDDDAGGDDDDDDDDMADDTGCGCAAPGSSTPSSTGALLLLGWWARRRAAARGGGRSAARLLRVSCCHAAATPIAPARSHATR